MCIAHFHSYRVGMTETTMCQFLLQKIFFDHWLFIVENIGAKFPSTGRKWLPQLLTLCVSFCQFKMHGTSSQYRFVPVCPRIRKQNELTNPLPSDSNKNGKYQYGKVKGAVHPLNNVLQGVFCLSYTCITISTDKVSTMSQLYSFK